MKKERKNYVNNASLLKEIHNSKLTFCYYEEEKYADYDIICDNYNMITPNQLETFFQKNKNRDYAIIRVMTAEHVLPFCTTEKINLQELKMNPFKHFKITKEAHKKTLEAIDKNCLTNIDILNQNITNLKETIKENMRHVRFYKNNKKEQEPFKEENASLKAKIEELNQRIKDINTPYSEMIIKEAEEVLRSHWKGGFENGTFAINQGHLTDNLVNMIILMVDQYGTSGNWSGYSYIDDMKSSALVHLCEIALKFEESKSSNPFAYYTTVASMKFTATVNNEKQQSKIKSELLQDKGYKPSFNEQIESEIKWREEDN